MHVSRLSLELRFDHKACMFRVYKEICIYTQDMFTDYTKQMTSQEFAHEHVLKGLNDR